MNEHLYNSLSQISRDNVISALKVIADNPSLINNRQSSKYDLVFDGKKYPPMLVLSESYKQIGGEGLTLEDFGNSIDKPFEILRSLDFSIVPKGLRYWIEKTLVNNREDRKSGEYALGKVLWSPIQSQNGADIYASMRELSEGDIVIHLTDNRAFTGVSKVKSSFRLGNGVIGSPWEGEAYIVDLKDFTTINPLERGSILNRTNENILKSIKQKNKVFYNSELNLNQGSYLTECPIELAELINNEYRLANKATIPFLPISDKAAGYHGPSFNCSSFSQALKDANLCYGETLLSRFVASLMTKGFLILTGLAGSGKTKLAQSFVKWICDEDKQYKIVPVGADWTNREPLLGYPNALSPGEYVKPDNEVLDLIIQANGHPEKPYFLILDEMNLSHVERYFADFLSVMESDDFITLHDDKKPRSGVPPRIKLPRNLFIIGTVNIDETTNMFSPKVLDRANTIEFRVSELDMISFLKTHNKINIEVLCGQGANMANGFLALSAKTFDDIENREVILSTLIKFFRELKTFGAEFGYRTASEILRLANMLSLIDPEISTHTKIDIAIVQKLLPKLHGSQRRLCPVLEKLASFCIDDNQITFDLRSSKNKDFDLNNPAVLYPISLEKIAIMYNRANENGFTSFAEA